VLLAAVAIVLVFGGIFAFLNVRRDARERAEKTAKKTAERISEEAANRYLQENLPEIISTYDTMMKDMTDIPDAQANKIAEEESS